MKATKALLITTVLVTGISAPAALGGAPMGVPQAVLGEGHWSLGAEFGHEQMDLQGSGTFRAVFELVPVEIFDFVETQSIEDVEMNMLFGVLAVGVCDNWDVFLRLGAADAQGDVTATADIVDFGIPGSYSVGDFDSDAGLAFGAGTRATFCRWGPLSIGGLMQVTWFEPDDGEISYPDPIVPPPPQGIHVGEASLDFWETQISLAAIYQVDTLRLWAGPFVQFIEGDLDRSGIILFDGVAAGDTFDASSEIQEESQFGAHFGANWEVANRWNLWLEGQITGDSWLIGVGTFFATGESSFEM